MPVEGIIKKGRKRERGEEGKRKKKGKKKKEGRKEENKSFNGSTHSLTKFTVLDPPVALHKDINNCSYLENISPK